MGFSEIRVPVGGPHNKDHSILGYLGSIFGSPRFGKLPDLFCFGRSDG